MNKTLETSSSDQTEELGKEIAQNLRGGDVVCLYGELGSGKTTFVKGLSTGLGIKSRIISPTFVVIRTHKVENEHGIEKIYHLDLYRLHNEKEVSDIGLSEILEDKNAVTIIEWPEKAAHTLPKKRIDIHFEYMDEMHRKIKIRM